MTKITHNTCLSDTIAMVCFVFIATYVLCLTYEANIPHTFDAESALEAGKAYANYVVYDVKDAT